MYFSTDQFHLRVMYKTIQTMRVGKNRLILDEVILYCNNNNNNNNIGLQDIFRRKKRMCSFVHEACQFLLKSVLNKITVEYKQIHWKKEI